VKQRTIKGTRVGAIGLGCMGMSWAYGFADTETSLRVLNRALELGVNHWDTADLYGAGDNEKLIAMALKGNRDKVFLATKFGNVTDRSMTSHQDLVAQNAGWIVDGTPAYARKSIEKSLAALETDHVDLYYLHRVDSRTPIEETVGEMARFVAEGKTKAIGLSEVTAETLRRAHAVHPIAAVQNEASLWTRDSIDNVLAACKELGIAFVPYSPLGRGFLTGAIKSIDDLAEDDWRRDNPRFQGENFEKNIELVRVVERVASARESTAAQVALAWVLALGDHVCPIPGTRKVKYLEENVRAVDLELTTAKLDELNCLSQAAGARYPEAAMQFTLR